MKQLEPVNPELSHDILVEKMRPKFNYVGNCDYEAWKNSLREKFIELTGLDEIEKNVCPLSLQIEWEKQKDGYKLIRFVFDSEIGETVPCYLLIPDTGKEKYPVVITLQGHSTGFHNSIGEIKFASDRDYQPRGSFALQAVENGFIALAIEQRGMGERKPISENRLPQNVCQYASRIALGLGRTILGERVWDIHRAIDAISYFSQCDLEKILITGNSGGGTASYYAACYEERIKLCVPSCSFCSYKESILSIAHCACNYIPFAYKYFDMQDLACMIAPRALIVIAGKEDDIFPIDGVKRGFDTVKKIYEQAQGTETCRLVETPKGHWWCEDIVWGEIKKECQRLGWF